MTDAALVWLIAVVLVVATSAPFVARRRRRERRGRAAEAQAIAYGLHEPVSLHPVIDAARCAGCGACVDACPEGDVLALIGGQAKVIAPARCVGHGLCERSCPTEAIALVFGTASRGVELPRIQGNFETNVPGLYIVGELGGMGLVRNAFEQGRQCIEYIAKEARAPAADAGPDVLDAVIVGCGPAGLAATVTARHRGLRTATLEREPDLGGTVRHYPRRKLVMTRPIEVPGYGTLRFTEVQKEDLIAAWADVAARTGVAVRTGATVQAVRPLPGHAPGTPLFEVEADGGPPLRTRRVILAIGRRGVPRKLGVPGEDREGVYYSLAEPEHFAGRRALVVGGGDSAVEAALMLADQPGTTVHLSYRKDRLARVKPKNLERFEAAVAAGRLAPVWRSEVAAIGADAATLTTPEGALAVPADDVFVFIGGELPTAFLQACGIALDTHFGTPRR